MKKNVGSIDKVIRLLIAAILVVLFFANIVTGVTGYVMLALAGILTLTSLVSFCPIWAVFGINTCPAKE